MTADVAADTMCADCSHPRADHMHYREGTECVVPLCFCVRYRMGFLGWLRWLADHRPGDAL